MSIKTHVNDECPPMGYGWLDDNQKRKRVINLFKQGYDDPWMRREKHRMQIEDYEHSIKSKIF